MRKKYLFLPFLCILFFFSFKIFPQIDTITRLTIPPYVQRVRLYDGGYIHIDRIGLVENKILYGSQTIDGNDVMLVDLNDLNTPFLEGTIQRNITTQEEFFSFVKHYNTVFFNDSNILRIYDVKDLKNPVEKHAVQFKKEIFLIINEIKKNGNDTFYIVCETVGGIEEDLFKYYYDYINQPDTIKSYTGLGGGPGSFFLTDYYIIFGFGRVYIWKLPLYDSIPDWQPDLPVPSLVMGVKGNYAFISTLYKTRVFDFNNFNGTLKLIDTLDGGGDDIEVYKNLLLVGKNELHIFDIGDINNVQKKAIFIHPNEDFKIDSSNNYVYCNQVDYLDVIDLTKYVDTTTSIQESGNSIQNSGVSIFYSKNGSVYLKGINGVARAEIYDFQGRNVKTLPVTSKSIYLEDINGIYIVRLVGKDITRQFKVMLTK